MRESVVGYWLYMYGMRWVYVTWGEEDKEGRDDDANGVVLEGGLDNAVIDDESDTDAGDETFFMLPPLALLPLLSFSDILLRLLSTVVPSACLGQRMRSSLLIGTRRERGEILFYS